jgi:hypothetical protein
MKPSLFYGSAIAAALGLALGLALHGPWRDGEHGGGPQLLVAAAAAAERRGAEPDIVETPPAAEETVADASQLPPDPLPVTRLTRRGGTAVSASEDVERIAANTASDETQELASFRDVANSSAPNGDAR